mmetsp:Transcript_4590/g.17292  ORF Transcript_4590/g.17292 Transcript_4590/m.17292 type:complete len:411 (+) Transcript_4590:67-1299(+)
MGAGLCGLGPGPKKSFSCHVGQERAECLNQDPPRSTRPTRALLIGINYEGTAAALKGCQNDALDMKQLLTSQYGYLEENVRLMLDRAGSELPSRANILAGTRWLVAGAQPGDCLFFHYSGHGGQQEDPDCAEEDCMDETILPQDFQRAGMIVDDELFEVMIRSLPSGVKLTAVMDCCHSGTGLDLPFTYNSGGGGYSFGMGGAGRWSCDDNPCHSEGHVVLLSGCCDDQTSAEVQSMYNKPRGAMTEAFVETLTRNPVPTYNQLLDGLRGHLREKGHHQYPQLTSSQQFDIKSSFEISGGICPNSNPIVGRFQTKQKFPKRQWMPDGDPLNNMLMGMMAADLLGDGLFGGGLFGGGYGGGGGLFGGGGGYGYDNGFSNGGGGLLDSGWNDNSGGGGMDVMGLFGGGDGDW